MKIVSPLLKHVIYPGLSKAGYLRRAVQLGPVVLTYHGILPAGYKFQGNAIDGHLITAASFRSQICLLKKHFTVISPEQFRRWCTGQSELPPRSVLLTCDDGLLNVVTDMLPMVHELDVPFLFFVTGASASDSASMLWHEQLELWRLRVAKRICLRMPWRAEPYVAEGDKDKRFLWFDLRRKLSSFSAGVRKEILEDMRIQIGISEDWQAEYSQSETLRRRFFVLNRTHLRELAGSGFEIGAHTLSHPMLSEMSEELAFDEIELGRTQLEQALHRKIWALAYPFGNDEAVTHRESDLARRAGFDCAFLNVECASEPFLFGRIHVSAVMSLPEFEAHISGFHRSLRGALPLVVRGIA